MKRPTKRRASHSAPLFPEASLDGAKALFDPSGADEGADEDAPPPNPENRSRCRAERLRREFRFTELEPGKRARTGVDQSPTYWRPVSGNPAWWETTDE